MTRKQEGAAQIEDLQFREAVRNSAQQIWQAGLGAFAAARDEGSGLFSRLVKEGSSLQMRTQQMAGQKLSDVIAKMTETLGKQAAGPLGKMEEVFEERVARTLRTFGVPTQDDLKTLTREIEDLRKTVTALSGAGTTGKKATAKTQAAKALQKAVGKSGANKAAAARPLKKRAKPQLESRA